MNPETSQPYTILRIKRKRNEEPLDALVIEGGLRRKKSKPGGVFKFAHTLEDKAWADATIQQQIQHQVSRLAAVPTPPPTVPLPEDTLAPTKRRRTDRGFTRRYTIREQDLDTKTQTPTSLPTITSTTEAPENASRFTIFDAVPEVQKDDLADPEMDKIMPLLQAYLNVHEPNLAPQEPEGDYVWDIFYHRPVTLSEWNSAATVGTLTGLPPSLNDPYSSDSDLEVEDEADEDSNAEEYFANDYPDEEDRSNSETGSSDEFHDGNSDLYDFDD